ncbi:MAG: M20/M25/M40 family metallo-hydrolase [Woeseia sp.]
MQQKLGVTLLLAALLPGGKGLAADSPHDKLAYDIFADLIAANTAPSGGNDTRVAVAGLVQRLESAGFTDDEITVVGQTEQLPNLIVRYRSKSPAHKPLLMMAHIDVVEALPEDWSVEPFKLIEKDGYYYGRGTTDNKAGAAMLVANFIRLRQEGFAPNRDLIMMLTADEESTGDAALWLTTEKRELIDAELALNTDAGLVMEQGNEPRAFMMQTSEKLYVSFTLEALDPGGHSSLPKADNAIARLARAIVDLHAYRFPIDLNDTTREFFKKWRSFAPAEERPIIDAILASAGNAEGLQNKIDSPYYNALARTTCVATGLSGGHAENALPQSARATINCRVLPQSSAEATKAMIEKFAAPHGVSVSQIAIARQSPPSPLDEQVMGPVAAVTKAMWGDIPIIPEMSTGATDGLFVRNVGIPVYGVSGIAEDPNDIRAHGQDERIGVKSFYDATEFWYLLLKAMTGRSNN